MTIFGRPLSQYAEFCKPFLVLVPVAGIVRLALSLGGVVVGPGDGPAPAMPLLMTSRRVETSNDR